MKDLINQSKLPKHIAVIMDGNGRWARKKGTKRIFGHKNAVEAVRQIVEASAELGVGYLTLFTFSTENWGRPHEEVKALMELLVSTIHGETKTLMKNNIRLESIGNIFDLPQKCQRELSEAKKRTKTNTSLTLILALNYSGKWDMQNAIRNIVCEANKKKILEQDISYQLIEKYLSTAGIPEPELLIRTGGEMRISNFYLWQLAYTELYVMNTLWPDFRKEHLYEAILSYQSRERRFGKITTQKRAEPQ